MALEALKIKSCPSSFSELAAAHNALVAFIASAQGQNGIKVSVSDGNMIFEYTGTASGITQAEFNAMLENACDTLDGMIRAGCLYSPVYDVATFAAADAVGNIPRETIDVCGIGAVTFLVE